MVTAGFKKRGLGLVSSLSIAVIFALLLQPSTLASQKALLAWQPSADTNVVGYNVYYGLASGNYSTKVSLLNVTSTTILGLVEGKTYYFVVTAYNAAHLESLPSNEVSYRVPGVLLQLQQIQMRGFPNALFVSSTGLVPYSWVLEGTEDFKTWRTLFRGTNSAVNVTVAVYGVRSLFFRLKRQ